MITLTDAQTDAIIHATRPLQPSERAAFLAALVALFADRNEIGDGELGRALRDLQQQHFRPPTATETGMMGTRHKPLHAPSGCSYQEHPFQDEPSRGPSEAHRELADGPRWSSLVAYQRGSS